MACRIEDLEPSQIILGCTDPLASNFNADATVDDNSCLYTISYVSGCTDPSALNFNADATVDDGSCVFKECPTVFEIRPSDGVVFYTEYTQVKGVSTTGPTNPTVPVSVPLTEDCCTEAIVGQPVIWDGTFCKITSSGKCPEPLSVSVEGVILSSFGTPVNETCCSYVKYGVWDPNYQISTATAPGACIDISFNAEECNLSLSDLVFNNDGSISVLPDPIFTGTTGNSNVDSGGLLGDTGQSTCVNLQNWFVVPLDNIYSTTSIPLGYPNGNVVVLTTNDANALNIPQGQQIQLIGMDVVPLQNTCYNITSISTLNTVTTVLDVVNFPGSSLYYIYTSIYIPSSEAISNNCVNVQGPPETSLEIVVDGSGYACLVFGQPEPGPTNGCIPFNSFFFDPLYLASSYITTINGNNTNLCNLQNLYNNDYYLYVITSDPSILNLNDCSDYEFDSSFNQALADSCWGQVYTVYETDQYGNQSSILQGQLDVNFTTATLLAKNIVNSGQYAGNYIALFNISIPGLGGDSLKNNQSCGTIEYSGQVCLGVGTGNKTPVPSVSKKQPPYNLSGDFSNILDILNNNTSNPSTELTEICCEELGNGFWTFVDGKCYWKAPKLPELVSLGISENDVIVTDSGCDTLRVCMSFFLERPDRPECDIADNNITASLGIYSGDIATNLLNVTQVSTFDLSRDGYCQWINLCIDVTGFEGIPFKIKLNLDGVLDCCDYEVYVDDISVNCTIQDEITVLNQSDCPGFKLRKVVDNKKSWVYNDGEVINRIFAPSVDADIPWRYTNYFEQSGVYETHSKLVLNTKELQLTFNMCSGENCSVSGTSLSVYDLINYKNNFQNFWVKFIEQFVPATTIFVAGEKWCTREDQICQTYTDCNYNNNFSLSDLGITHTNGDTNKRTTNITEGSNVDINIGTTTITSTKTGDYGTNNTDQPIITKNFVGSFIPNDTSTLVNKELTLIKGLLPLLEKGMTDFRSKINTQQTINIII